MKRKAYISPSLRYINMQEDALLVSSSYQISVSDEAGVWEADANREGEFASIWDTDDHSLWN